MSSSGSDEKLLFARAEDAIRICENSGTPKFFGFLDESSAALVHSFVSSRTSDHLLFGGFDDAERVMLGVFPDWCGECREDYFPISALTLSFRKGENLSHRDFLGSIMGLRIKREAVGDILCEDGRAVIFALKEAAALIKNELVKVGRTGVTVSDGFALPLPGAHKLTECSATVPSARLDACIAAISGTGRSEAVRLIESGMVTVNSFVCEKCTRAVSAGDVIKIRGKGKYIMDSLCDFTKKQRIILKYKKYC